MPVRLLRDGILDSERVNALGWPAEVFYRRLMSVVDDYGRFDARPAVLRGRLYALKVDQVREADISRHLAECEAAGLLALYAVAGRPYLLLHRLGTPRAKVSKYPPLPAALEQPAAGPADASTRPATARPPVKADANGCVRPRADAHDRSQTPAGVPYSGSDSGMNPKEDQSPSETGGAPPPPAAVEPAPAVESAPKAGRRRKVPDTAHAAAVEAFCSAWQARYAARYPFNGGKDGEAVRVMLGQVGGDPDRFRAVVGRYFADASEFVAGKRHPLGVLRSQFATWLVAAPAGRPAGGTQGDGRAGSQRGRRPGGGVGCVTRIEPPAGKYDCFGRPPDGPPPGGGGPDAAGPAGGPA